MGADRSHHESSSQSSVAEYLVWTPLHLTRWGKKMRLSGGPSEVSLSSSPSLLWRQGAGCALSWGGGRLKCLSHSEPAWCWWIWEEQIRADRCGGGGEHPPLILISDQTQHPSTCSGVLLPSQHKLQFSGGNKNWTDHFFVSLIYFVTNLGLGKFILSAINQQ